MQITTYPLGQQQANCYLLVEGKGCLLIDPGDSADFILEKIQRENLDLLGIFATHGHFDHIMAVGEIQLSYDVPFYIHKDDLFLVKRLEQTAKHFLGYDPHVIKPKNIPTFEPGVLHISNFTLHILPIPGHTPGSIAIYCESENAVFTGDTLLKKEVGDYKHSYSDKKLLAKSLKALFSLPIDTIVYPGHGEETSIGEEKELVHFM